MNILSEFGWGPKKTPKIIQYLLVAIAASTLLSATLQMLFDFFYLFPGPQDLFSLHWRGGVARGFVWQLFTYLFVEWHSDPLSLPYLVTLFSSLYLLWILGTAILNIIDTRLFFIIYFTSGILSGILAVLTMPLFRQYTVLTGIDAPLITLLTIWGMTLPHVDIHLFGTISIKIKWIAASILSAIFFFRLSQWDIPELTLAITAATIGYFFAIAILNCLSPFSWSQSFDHWLTKKSLPLKTLIAGSGNKIANINAMDDETFISAMLEKISKEGEEALSWYEQERLQDITQKKSGT